VPRTPCWTGGIVGRDQRQYAIGGQAVDIDLVATVLTGHLFAHALRQENPRPLTRK